MYDELIKRLRRCAVGFKCRECEYDNLNGCRTTLNTEAAKAIEELQQITTHYEEESKGWWLAACDAKEERERLKEQIPKWIPVTERLPKNHQHCLVFTDTHRMGYFAKNLEKVDEYDFQGEKHHGWYYLDSEWGYCEIRNVSYWMPLPQPPEDGEP